ncbi:hypothetical protein [Frateuria terrea]|uniref:Uncharacterized protein n=1 Tax=Frateuria terrea TaxID=529704 RepID=A0A1H6QLH7_9GAMM|nr:hypothetical protein [Frateuria terrea]SEI44568.1 hypothetical protein SAMN04487997_0702 [Frateuria terrea]SFP10212.1 hypothetical protein SAMN02927913_0618 [Frateuria terrea]
MNRIVALAVTIALGWGVTHACHAEALPGISIGQALQLPQCDERQGEYLPDDRTTCFKLPAGPTDDGSLPANGQVVVNVALPDRPDYMSGSDAVVQLRDGRVASVSVRTHGPARDSRDFAALQDAFGRAEPRYVSTTEPVQTYASMRADWNRPGGETVYFDSAEFGGYYGLVRIQTPQAPAHHPGIWD